MLECWKEKEGKRKGGEDLRLVHRLKQLTASWAWSTIPLSWEHSVTVSFSPNVPTDPGTTQRMRIPAHVNPDDQVGRSSKRTWGETCQPRQREVDITWGPQERGGKEKASALPQGQPLKQALQYGCCSTDRRVIKSSYTGSCALQPGSICTSHRLWAPVAGTMTPLLRWENWGF